MINSLNSGNLRNPEHVNFVNEIVSVLKKHNPDNPLLKDCCDEIFALRDEEVQAMDVELGNVLSKQVSAAEQYRDRLHGGLYYYVKSFLYDDAEAARFDAAQRIMRIMQQVGNPTKLSDSAETALLDKLADQLQTYAADLELLGATGRLQKLTDANRRFVELSTTRREDNLSRPSGNVKAVRLKIDPVCKALVNAINLLSRKDTRYAGLIDDFNAVTAKYNQLLSNRQSRKNSNDAKGQATTDAATQ
jgi:hypothetical protein